MHILILNWRDPSNPLSGGAEYVTSMHAQSWVKKGHRVTWFSSAFEGSKETDVKKDITYIRRGNSITVFFYAFLYYMSHKKDFDIIVDEVHGIPFFAKLYARIPVIVFVHEVAEDIWGVMYPFPFSWIGSMLEKFYIWVYGDHLFWTDAESTRDELISLGVSKNRCIAIPCPIRNDTIKSLPIKNKQPTFLFVGRIVRMKRVEDVINAFNILLSSLPNAKLWIIGDGEKRYMGELDEMIKQYQIENHIVWWGNVSEKRKLQLMAKAHLLLHASVKEGWGLVVLEAASQATPAVAYPSGGLRDTIKHGQTGILTKRRLPSQLAFYTLKVYNNTMLYRRLQKNGILWSKSFHWHDATTQSLSLLQLSCKG